MLRNPASVYEPGCSRAKKSPDSQTDPVFNHGHIQIHSTCRKQRWLSGSLVPKSHLSLSHKVPLSHTESHGKQLSDIKSETDEALVFFPRDSFEVILRALQKNYSQANE